MCGYMGEPVYPFVNIREILSFYYFIAIKNIQHIVFYRIYAKISCIFVEFYYNII